MESVAQWVVLAQILRPQGRRGEVLADLFTDFPERFERQPQVWLAAPGFAGGNPVEPDPLTGSGSAQKAEVLSHWLPVGRNSGRIVLHLAGVDSIEQAEQLAGKEVIVPLSERLPLESGATYISDLIGCVVYDRGVALGSVDHVEFPTSPDGSRRLDDAAPLLVITTPEGEEILVPFVSAYLIKLDVDAKAIRMALPEGLAEINK